MLKRIASRAALLAFALGLSSGAHALIGDVNGDGKVDITDARLIANYLVGNSTSLPHPENADVNNDGRITTADALLILQFSKGLRTSFSSASLQVLASMPANGASGILLTAEFNVFFSEPILNGSLAGISLTDVVTGQPVAGTVTLSQDGVIATFHPSQPLQTTRNYTINVSTAITDIGGNPLKQAFASSFQTQALGTLSLNSVNNSTAAINSLLSQPISVKAISATGVAVPNVPVVFSAQMGNGMFQPNGLRQVTVPTDINGVAQATYQTGGQALQNTVAISAIGFSTIPAFAVTTLPSQPANLRIYSGNNQSGAPQTTAPFPLVAQVTDPGGDGIAGTTVTFAVTQGQGNLGGGPVAGAVTDSAGNASVPFVFGSSEGLVLVQASFQGMIGQPPVFNLQNLVPQGSSRTVITGTVVDAQTLAGLEHVYVYLADNPSEWDWTDHAGFFLLQASSGPHVVEVDGYQSGILAGHLYPVVAIPVNAVQGKENDLGAPALLPELDDQSYLDVSDVVGGTLTLRSNPQWQLYVPPGSAHFVNGTATGRLYVASVPVDKIPMPVAGGRSSHFVDTIQPLNVVFNPPAQVRFPNADNLPPGTVTDIFTLSYASGTFSRTGRGKVSEDGNVIQSLAGQGITQGGWHLAPPPSPVVTTCASVTPPGKGTLTSFGLSIDPPGTIQLCNIPAPGLFAPIFKTKARTPLPGCKLQDFGFWTEPNTGNRILWCSYLCAIPDKEILTWDVYTPGMFCPQVIPNPDP